MQAKSVVISILSSLRVPPNTKGYLFLLDAILLCTEDTGLISRITTRVYPDIADKYGSNPACVERLMRYAIQRAYEDADKTLWAEHFGAHRKIKVSEFIGTITMRLQ